MSTSYRLREGLSYCRVDGQVIFLDIQNDRYFRLSGGAEDAFLAYIGGGPIPATALATLTEHHVLSKSSQSGSEESDLSEIPMPTRSATELSDLTDPLNLRLMLEVATSVLSTWWMLRTRGLAHVIDNYLGCRRKHAQGSTSWTESGPYPDICKAAISFHRARLYVPIRTSCLLDSVALSKFLSRRRIRTSLVFGITRVPFAAHCWVQFGDVVLNDAVGNVTSHTPIRVI